LREPVRGKASLVLDDGTSLTAEIEYPDNFDLMGWPATWIRQVIRNEMAKGKPIVIRIEWSPDVAPEDRGGHLWDIIVWINDRPRPLPDHSRPHDCERECAWKDARGAREILYADGGPPCQP